jgi:hypothetical protein
MGTGLHGPPETWRLITDGPGSIVGYWHFVPLFEEEFERAKNGLLHDSEVTTDKVRLFELPGEYDMYVTIFCLKPRFRRPLAVTKLFDSFLDMLTLLARQGVFFREICANSYSASGVKLCRHFGMTPHKDHSSRGVIYTRRVLPVPAAGHLQPPCRPWRGLCRPIWRGLNPGNSSPMLRRAGTICRRMPGRSSSSAKPVRARRAQKTG